MSSLAVATLIAAGWLIPLALMAPRPCGSWFAIELASFSPPNHEASALRDWVKLLAWFVWPLWPLALWRLWRARKRMSEPALAIPLLALVLGMLHLLTFGSPSPARVMPLIVPLALLAARRRSRPSGGGGRVRLVCGRDLLLLRFAPDLQLERHDLRLATRPGAPFSQARTRVLSWCRPCRHWLSARWCVSYGSRICCLDGQRVAMHR